MGKRTILKLLIERWRDRPYRVGKRLAGRYRVTRVLGMGSYGISYLCDDTESAQPVVVKQVLPSRRHGAKGQPIYQYETGVLAMMDHPGIPKLLATFTWRDGLFFAMEYMAGDNYEDLIFEKGERYDERAALRVNGA